MPQCLTANPDPANAGRLPDSGCLRAKVAQEAEIETGSNPLAEWKLACGRPADTELVFPAASGGPWLDHDYVA